MKFLALLVLFCTTGWNEAEVCQHFPAEKNVALQGTATQSSIYDARGRAGHAIDGNSNSNYFSSSCTATKNDFGPWWRLDLAKTYKVSSITITNRGDCCPQRLNGAVIHVGNSLDNNGNDNPTCGSVTSLSAGSTQTFCCEGMGGRYVSINIPGRREFLSLCEVEVMGVPGTPQCQQSPAEKNVALQGTATQSSIYDARGRAGHAIDGDSNSNYFSSSCTATKNDFGPWWRLDLAKTYKVSSITITNRGDCCPQRLNGAVIHVGNSLDNNGNDNPTCGSVTSLSAGSTQTFCCEGMGGRYVSINIPGRREFLSLCEVEVMGVPGTPQCQQSPAEKNVALQGTATQSSIYDARGRAGHAIDGDSNSNYFSSSCTATKNDFGPWWRLDLAKTYKVSSITITNRGDCCPQRLNGAVIHVGNSLDNNGNDNPTCGSVTSLSAGSTQTFCCEGMGGRYVSINIPGRREFLSLCEVEVMGVPGTPQCQQSPAEKNVALQGTATQSSIYDARGRAGHAIDGDSNSNYFSSSCTATKNDFGPWWRLDLAKTYKVSSITITNRGDCCPQRLNGAVIHVGNSLDNNGNDNPTCGSVTSLSAGSTQTFCCEGMGGRYVSINIPGRREFLSLCEVEVMGVPGTPQCQQSPAEKNVALQGTATQSSIYDARGRAGHAIDGDSNSNYFSSSCTATKNDFGPWWRLDLAKTYKVSSITITNRGDCCPQRLNGAVIHVGNSLDNNGNDNPTCGSVTSLSAGSTQTFCCEGMEGRYVSINIPGRREFLSLCEVEVFGVPGDTLEDQSCF
ncbi:uncharacterized protein LOC102363098 [Latimeria chalumnae]|uniref:uncharacterized protein LOC102363098 n=1 Tax=Latimeria chalumnae TaxID=7897 RepID=UPI00313CDC87